ncbi:MAG: T9SS type A sorting domain-containing protein [Bacteroidales bacterium]
MKNKTALLLILATAVFFAANSQSTIIISENFQLWEATEDTDETTCSAGVVIEDNNTREMTLTVQGGTAKIPVTLIKCGIAPECESRRVEGANPPGSIENFPGVTTGWVLLNKLTDGDPTNDPDIPITIKTIDESPDTIGEFIFGPVPQIDSIIFAHSATGSQRGIRIYKSTNGVDWVNASPDDEFCDGADTQRGDVNTVVINETNVYIKFTSGFRLVDSTSQYSRLHNLDVYGIPGKLSNINNVKQNNTKIYYNSGSDVLIVDENVISVNIYDCLGKLIKSQHGPNLQTISMSGLRKSIYIIEAYDNNNNRIVKKIIKY